MPQNGHQFSPRERFLRTMCYEACDRPPLWEEGVMDETWEAWRSQGLESADSFRKRHVFDRHELAELNLFPIPEFQHSATEGFPELRGRYRTDTGDRLPKGWPAVAEPWAGRDHPLGVTVSRGLLLSCGVRNWNGLVTVLQTFYDRPAEIDATMACVTEMALSLLRQLTEKATPDFAVFNEPIAGFNGPVLSPEHYRRFCFTCYARLIQALQGMGVSVLVVRTWGNALPLIPLWLELGLDTLWNEHCNAAGDDYVALRRRFGKNLRLIGGIDSRALYQDRRAVDDAIERVVPPLLEDGGYLPSVDDRVRSNVPFENYRYYRERLAALVGGG